MRDRPLVTHPLDPKVPESDMTFDLMTLKRSDEGHDNLWSSIASKRLSVDITVIPWVPIDKRVPLVRLGQQVLSHLPRVTMVMSHMAYYACDCGLVTADAGCLILHLIYGIVIYITRI